MSTPNHHARLSESEACRLVECVAELTAGGLPLAEGLRVAAVECRSRRLSRALETLAQQVAEGRPLEAALAEVGERFPSDLRALVRAAAETGAVGEVLMQAVLHRQRTHDTRQSIRAALAYPTLLFFLLIAVFALVSITAIQPIRSVIQEWELDTPYMTTALFWIAEQGVWLLIAAIALGTIAAVVLRNVLGAARYNALLALIPLIGPAWRWSAVAELARNVRTLLKQNLPMPRVLRAAAEASSDAYVGELCRDLAAAVEGGTFLSLAVREDGRLPVSLTPHLHAGEIHNTLPEAFDAIAELFDDRVETRSTWLRQILPPFMFVFIGIAVISLMSAMLPLIQMISRLS